MSFSQMHNDYLDQDRAGLNDEIPLDLTDGRTLKGYGRSDGLYGKNADLDHGGQNYVKEAWWYSDGPIDIYGHRYASIVPNENATDNQLDIATEIICGENYPGEWDGDYWVLGEDYHLKVECDWDDDKTEAENIAVACGVAYDAIMKDSETFEKAMTELSKAVEDATDPS